MKMGRETKKMQVMMRGAGLMCHSPASTAVCVPDDLRAVIVPARRSSSSMDAKYSRLRGRTLGVNMDNIGHGHSHPAAAATPTQTQLLIGCRRQKSFAHLPQERDNITKKQQPPLPLVLLAPSEVIQEVVLRVSLHCQGCAGKVKKHLSKMEGVTSFSIDLETKRVTVMGHITPSGVLESISKVKRAELWG